MSQNIWHLHSHLLTWRHNSEEVHQRSYLCVTRSTIHPLAVCQWGHEVTHENSHAVDSIFIGEEVFELIKTQQREIKCSHAPAASSLHSLVWCSSGSCVALHACTRAPSDHRALLRDSRPVLLVLLLWWTWLKMSDNERQVSPRQRN